MIYLVPAGFGAVLTLAIYCAFGMILYHFLPSILMFFAYLIGGIFLLIMIFKWGKAIDKKEAAKKAQIEAERKAEEKARQDEIKAMNVEKNRIAWQEKVDDFGNCADNEWQNMIGK